VKITREISKTAAQTGVLAGTIVDPVGATVLGAKITIFDQKTKTSHATQSNSDGHFELAGLAPGAYDIIIEASGFKRLEVKNLVLGIKEAVSLELILEFDSTTVTVGLLMDTSSIDTSTPGTIIIPGEILRKLPINN
jgi:hypothetical protein